MKKILAILLFCFILFMPIGLRAEQDYLEITLQESEQFIYPGYYFVGTDIQSGIFELRLVSASEYNVRFFVFDSKDQYQDFYEAKTRIVPKIDISINSNDTNIPYHFSLDDDDILFIRDPGIYAIKRVTTTY